ncbi:MAG: hypothetical protein Kow00121_21880 [Elainellaceae cyanobacterium]
MSNVSWKDLPVFVRWLARPALFLSIGLHAIVLLVPMFADDSLQTVEEPDSEEQQVTLVSPPVPSPAAASTPTPTPVAPSVAKSPSPAPAPAATPQLAPQVTATPPPATSPPVAVPPSEPVEAQSPAPASPAAPTSVNNTPATPPPAPASRINAPFADFPHLTAAETGCSGTTSPLCRQVEGNLRATSQQLQDQLQAQGYEVKVRDDLEETGRQVYQVSKAEATSFLSVISSGLGETVYVLAAEPVTQADLEQLATVQTDLDAALSGLSQGDRAVYAQFAYPELFFVGAEPRPEITGQFYLMNGKPVEQAASLLTNELQQRQFQLTPIGEYGGGSLYEVKRRAFTGYLNLLATQDGTGSIVVWWQRLPE